MEAVAEVPGHEVAGDAGIGGELEVDAVAVAAHAVARDLKALAGPGVDAVAVALVPAGCAANLVVADDPVARLGEIDAETATEDPVVLNGDMAGVGDLDAGDVGEAARAAVLNVETANGHLRGGDGEHLVSGAAVEPGVIKPDEGDGFVHDEIAFAVDATVNEDGIARVGRSEGGAETGESPTGADMQLVRRCRGRGEAKEGVQQEPAHGGQGIRTTSGQRRIRPPPPSWVRAASNSVSLENAARPPPMGVRSWS